MELSDTNDIDEDEAIPGETLQSGRENIPISFAEILKFDL